MKQFYYLIFSIFLFVTYGCVEKGVMNNPVSANNFTELADKLELLCFQVDNQTCGYINGAVYLYFPDYKTDAFSPTPENEAKAEKLFKKLNGKTPNQIIEIYKSLLLNNLNQVRRHDEEIIKNLDEMQAIFEKTKHYANNISVSNISIDLRKKIPELAFVISNTTDFNLKQLVVEVAFYTASETFLGKEKAFGYPLTPILEPGKNRTIKMTLSSIEDNDLILIRAAKNLKIKVLISSVQTDSKNEDEHMLMLSLPSSYFKMRELIKESDILYKDTVKKIKNINKK